MLSYQDRIEVPAETTLETAQAIVDAFRENGTAILVLDAMPRPTITFGLVIDGDLWDAALLLAEYGERLSSYGIGYLPNRAKLTEVPT